MLGGNIGDPARSSGCRELTPDHRVVIELSELQLPTLSRGTTVAVYTNVTSDHLDRHGSLEAYRRVKRRLAELVDPHGALVLNARGPGRRRRTPAWARAPVGAATGTDAPVPGGLGVVDGWIVAAAVRAAADRRRRRRGAGPGRDHAGRRAGIPGRHNVSNALAAIAVGLLFGVAPDAIRRAAAAFTGVEHRLELGAGSTASGSSTTPRAPSPTP